MNKDKKNAFEQASEAKSSGLVRQIIEFLLHNKKFWLLPLIAGLLFFGLILMLGTSALAPFIYPLF